MSTTATKPAYDLMPFRLAALYPPAKIGADLYLPKLGPGEPHRLYTLADRPPTQKDLDQLAQQGIAELFVSESSADELRSQLRDLLKQNISVPAHVKLEMVREEAKLNFSAAWKGKCTDALLVEATQFTNAIADVCSGGIDTTSVLNSLIAHDSDTFTHVSNVCTYAIILSQQLGVSDKVKLTEIGLAALLHDLGKRKINQNILKKAGPLTDEERAIIYDHPRLGFEELCEKDTLNQEQLLMIYHHHEKLNGSGYPVGLEGDEISWGARLCTVLDVFDAFTVRRAYRKAVTVDEALVYLEENSNTFFDAEMVRCWSNLVRNVISN